MIKNGIDLEYFNWEDFKTTLKWHKPDWGFGWWKGKPWFYIGTFWYDAPHYAIHLGPFHWYLGHWGEEREQNNEDESCD